MLFGSCPRGVVCDYHFHASHEMTSPLLPMVLCLCRLEADIPQKLAVLSKRVGKSTLCEVYTELQKINDIFQEVGLTDNSTRMRCVITRQKMNMQMAMIQRGWPFSNIQQNRE